jgi:hypothetical protein
MGTALVELVSFFTILIRGYTERRLSRLEIDWISLSTIIVVMFECILFRVK